jgi:potassium-dependent mechanosensitive channel
MHIHLRRLLSFSFFGWILFGASLLPAQDAAAPHVPIDADAGKDPALVLSRLDEQIDLVASKFDDKSSPATLNDLYNRAGELQDQAEQLVEALIPELEDTQTRLAVLGPVPSSGATPEALELSSQRNQLERDKARLDGQIKQAQLLRQDAAKLASQSIHAYRGQLQQQLGARTHSPLTPSFWREVSSALPADITRLGRVKASVIEQVQIAWLPDNRQALLLCLLGALLLIVPGRWLMERGALSLAKRYLPKRLRNSTMAVLFTLTVTTSVGAACWLIYLGLNWADSSNEQSAFLATLIVYPVLPAAFITGLGRVLLSVKHPSLRLPPLTKFTARRLRWFP